MRGKGDLHGLGKTLLGHKVEQLVHQLAGRGHTAQHGGDQLLARDIVLRLADKIVRRDIILRQNLGELVLIEHAIRLESGNRIDGIADRRIRRVHAEPALFHLQHLLAQHFRERVVRQLLARREIRLALPGLAQLVERPLIGRLDQGHIHGLPIDMRDRRIAADQGDDIGDTPEHENHHEQRKKSARDPVFQQFPNPNQHVLYLPQTATSIARRPGLSNCAKRISLLGCQPASRCGISRRQDRLR